jgi:hypothetical protein
MSKWKSVCKMTFKLRSRAKGAVCVVVTATRLMSDDERTRSDRMKSKRAEDE